jgi:hypothetical protein
MTEVTTIGRYLAKNVFYVHGADAAGAVTDAALFAAPQPGLGVFAKLPRFADGPQDVEKLVQHPSLFLQKIYRRKLLR